MSSSLMLSRLGTMLALGVVGCTTAGKGGRMAPEKVEDRGCSDKLAGCCIAISSCEARLGLEPCCTPRFSSMGKGLGKLGGVLTLYAFLI